MRMSEIEVEVESERERFEIYLACVGAKLSSWSQACICDTDEASSTTNL